MLLSTPHHAACSTYICTVIYTTSCGMQHIYLYYYLHHILQHAVHISVLLSTPHLAACSTYICTVIYTTPRGLLFVGCLTSQRHASVSQGRICSDKFTCCHTEIEVADQIYHLTQSQYTDTGPTSPSADPMTPGA